MSFENIQRSILPAKANSLTPRQGLVFDGTAAATNTIASTIGTSDFSIDCSFSVPSSTGTNYGIWYLSDSTAAWRPYDFGLSITTAGVLSIQLRGAGVGDYRQANVSTNLVSSLGGKRVNVVVTRSGGTLTIYVNGVSAPYTEATAGTPPAWSVSLPNNRFVLGGFGINNDRFTGVVTNSNIYNRALSASEVVSLYEAGAPAGADYNSASNTAINTSAWTNNTNPSYDFDTFSGSSAAGFTASAAAGVYAYAAMNGGTSRSWIKGTKYRLTYTLTINSGTAPAFQIQDGVNYTPLAAGTNTAEITVGSSTSAAGQIVSSGNATNFVLSGFSMVPLGLLLAPDAAQAGGGLVWYDTSGNAANITLPASGVSWNVPTNASYPLGWSFGSGGGNVGIGLTNPTLGQLHIQGNSDSASGPNRPRIAITNNAGTAQTWTIQTWSTSGDANLSIYRSAAAGGILLAPTGGNVIIGTTTDPGARLRVYGDGNSDTARIDSGGAIGASLIGFRTTSTTTNGAEITSYQAYNAGTRTSIIQQVCAGASDSGAINFLTKATGTAIATALTIDNNQHLKLTPATASSIVTTQSAPQVRLGSRAAGRSNVVLDSTVGRVWNFENTGPNLTIGHPNLDAITIAETTGNSTFSGDLILGSSGPSLKSTLSARASRQGLVFDGTNGASATLSSAIGTSNFSYSTTILVPASGSFTTATFIFGISDSGTTLERARAFQLGLEAGSGGAFRILVRGASSADYLANDYYNVITNYSGKTLNITVVRASSGDPLVYFNGILQTKSATLSGGTVPTWQDTVNGTNVHVGRFNTTTWIWNSGMSVIGLYNRALSAAEVLALYEAGAPKGSDYARYASTSGTLTNSITEAVLSGSTITSNSIVWSGNASTFNGWNLVESNSVSAYLKTGYRYRVSFTVNSLTNGGAGFVVVSRAAGINYYSAAYISSVLTAGTFSEEFTIPVSESNAGISISVTGGMTGGAINISNIVVKQVGLLLAPDAAQAGGGLVWYDTSGNAANITLPASGVSWNVPSSGYWGGNLTVSGTGNSGIAGNLIIGGGALSGSEKLMVRRATAGYTVVTTDGTTTGGFYNGSGLWLGTSSNHPLEFFTNGSGSQMRLATNGNLLIGNVGTDGGQKLQVAGAIDATGAISAGGNISATGSGNISNSLTTNGSGNYAAFELTGNDTLYLFRYGSAATGTYFGVNKASNAFLYEGAGVLALGTAGSKSVVIGTANTLALTIDSSQNATFTKSVTTGNFIEVSTGASTSVVRLTNTATGTGAGNGLTLEMGSGGTQAYLWNYENGTIQIGANNAVVADFTPANGIKLKGTTTNDSAAAGYVGEFVSSTVESGSAVSLTSTVVANVTSISLTAGDWDVTGIVAYSTSGATVTQFLQGLNNASASLGPTGSFSKINQSLSSDTDSWFHNAPTYRFSLSATSTVYLIARSYFSAGTVGAYGFIRARRVR